MCAAIPEVIFPINIPVSRGKSGKFSLETQEKSVNGRELSSDDVDSTEIKWFSNFFISTRFHAFILSIQPVSAIAMRLPSLDAAH